MKMFKNVRQSTVFIPPFLIGIFIKTSGVETEVGSLDIALVVVLCSYVIVRAIEKQKE